MLYGLPCLNSHVSGHAGYVNIKKRLHCHRYDISNLPPCKETLVSPVPSLARNLNCKQHLKTQTCTTDRLTVIRYIIHPRVKREQLRAGGRVRVKSWNICFKNCQYMLSIFFSELSGQNHENMTFRLGYGEMHTC